MPEKDTKSAGAAAGRRDAVLKDAGIREQLLYIQQGLTAPKNEQNAAKGFPYRTLEGIIEAVKPLLRDASCTLTFSEDIREAGGEVYVCTTATLTNTRGEAVSATSFAREDRRLPDMCGAQISGACVSYARKYAAGGLFAIDGNRLAAPLEIDSLLPESVEDWAGRSTVPPSPRRAANAAELPILMCGGRGWKKEVARVKAWQEGADAWKEDLHARWSVSENDEIVLMAQREIPFKEKKK